MRPKQRSTREYILSPRPCRACGRMMDKEFLEKRWAERNRNLSASLRSSDKMGRERSASYEEICELRSRGLSHRAIAHMLGCSQWTVYRALRDGGQMLEGRT